jgi:acetate kinase
VRITPDVRSRIAALAELAPLHNPPSLEALAAAEAELPDVPHVAVFDTAFHATLAPCAYTYPVPHQWTRDWGIRRYGFHGLSHAYCARRAAEMLDQPIEALRLVICHLGHGCSAAAVQAGRCIDTTMGYTPLEGLMMATRSG